MDRGSFLSFAALCCVAAATPARAASMGDELLVWAQRLVAELAPEDNVYGSRPTYVEWSDAASGRRGRNRSVCSSFASHLLEQSFGYTVHDIDVWFGKRGPQAREYHDTIAAGRGFDRIVQIAAIRPGDIIAVAYPAGSHPTGHVMVAASRAVERAPSAPFQPQTRQYEIPPGGRPQTRGRPARPRASAESRRDSGPNPCRTGRRAERRRRRVRRRRIARLGVGRSRRVQARDPRNGQGVKHPPAVEQTADQHDLSGKQRRRKRPLAQRRRGVDREQPSRPRAQNQSRGRKRYDRAEHVVPRAPDRIERSAVDPPARQHGLGQRMRLRDRCDR